MANLSDLSIQRGVETGSTPTTVAIDEVTIANAIVICSVSNTANRQTDLVIFRAYFSSVAGGKSSEITLDRYDTAGSDNTYEWQVIECTDFSVQHFVGDYSTGSATTSITIDAVDLTKTFPIFYTHTTDYIDQQDSQRCDITTTTNVDLISGLAKAAGVGYAVQIVEIDSASVTVEKVEHAWAGGTTETETTTGTFDLTKTFAVSGGMTVDAGGDAIDWAIVATMTAAQTLTMNRQSGSDDGDSICYVVELDYDNVAVQTDPAIVIGASTASGDHSLSPSVVLAESFVVPPMHNFAYGLDASIASDKQAGRSTLSTSANTLTRGDAGNAGTFGSQVISVTEASSGGSGGTANYLIPSLVL